mgnify:CR=1 FL=1
MNIELDTILGKVVTAAILFIIGIGVFFGSAQVIEQNVTQASVEGPFESTDSQSITAYEDMSENQKSVFRSHQSKIINSEAEVAVSDPSSFEDVDTISLDGQYYTVSTTSVTLGQYSPLLISGYLIVALFLIVLPLVIGVFLLADAVADSFAYAVLSSRISVSHIKYSLVLLMLVSSITFGLMIEIPRTTVEGPVEEPLDMSNNIIQYQELSSTEQNVFLQTFNARGDAPQLDQYTGSYIQSDGEYYLVEQSPAIIVRILLTIAVGFATLTASSILTSEISNRVSSYKPQLY